MGQLNGECIELIDAHISGSYPNVKRTTYEQYRTVLTKLASDLESHDRVLDPRTLDKDGVNFIINELWDGQAVATLKWKMHILERFLKFHGNDVIASMSLRWPQDTRPNVDWLTEPEMRMLQNSTKTPLQEVVINLELNCGLRSVEVIRLRLQDLHFGDGDHSPYLDVRGKGVGDGKWRTVPFGYNTEPALRQWIRERDNIIRTMRRKDPTWLPPDNLLLWLRYNGPRAICDAYSERGHSLDRSVIVPVRESLGLDFSHHTLRRTFGRTAYHAGVDVVTISKILGHEDTATTLKYLGINMDDMTAGMNILSGYLQRRL